MTGELLPPLGGHAVAVLLVQLSLLLVAARLGAELMKRVGLPAVVGELAAGIALGPSGLGHFFPGTFSFLFPHVAEQYHLLEVVGMLGMVLLLLLTGLETDLKLLKNMGRAALIASGMGMVVPFASGLLLGIFMPDQYLANPDQRVLFSCFLATTMAISAMPVIAKILLDLDLTRRNIGVVILSAGVIDDTTGWLILSVIAGVASHGELRLGSLVTTLIFTAGFLAAAALVVYPAARWLTGFVNRRFKTKDADLVMLLVVTLMCAAITEWIGVHAVFGAFVAGTLFRQVPQLKHETTRKLETFVFSVLGPVFFGIVGLKVDLWQLEGGTMLGIVLAVACIGKLFGVTLGSIWGGLRFWEGLSIAVAMNARGAMGLVVATIGLSLGILNQQIFSIIVMVAVITSFMAPLGLRLTMRKVRITEEESQRMLEESSRGAFDPARMRLLLAAGSGANFPAAALLAAGLVKKSGHPLEVVHVRVAERLRDRLRERLRALFKREQKASPDQVRGELQGHLAAAGLPQQMQELRNTDVSDAILAEARREHDVLVVGASRRGNSLGGPVLARLVREAPCHLVIVRAGSTPRPFRHLLVVYDGTTFARVAVELAVRYAEAEGAQLTVALVEEPEQREAAGVDGFEVSVESEAEGPSLLPEAEPPVPRLENVSPVFRATPVKPRVIELETGSALERAAEGGEPVDLVVLGAENRALRNRLFFGRDNERYIADENVSAAIVMANIGRLQ